MVGIFLSKEYPYHNLFPFSEHLPNILLPRLLKASFRKDQIQLFQNSDSLFSQPLYEHLFHPLDYNQKYKMVFRLPFPAS